MSTPGSLSLSHKSRTLEWPLTSARQREPPHSHCWQPDSIVDVHTYDIREWSSYPDTLIRRADTRDGTASVCRRPGPPRDVCGARDCAVMRRPDLRRRAEGRSVGAHVPEVAARQQCAGRQLLVSTTSRCSRWSSSGEATRRRRSTSHRSVTGPALVWRFEIDSRHRRNSSAWAIMHGCGPAAG